MGKSFGIFTKSLGNVKFANMKASLVSGQENPNNPDNPNSPNRPRSVGRTPEYQNPELGDPGNGKIGRWHFLTLDALEMTIQQIIEQYLRDKSFYSSVRCREALWNMYRRLQWWVNQQVDPSRNDYQRVLLMIKDCINHVLEEAQDPALAHNISLPICPVPYFWSYHGDYFNHYDSTGEAELKLFDSRDIPQSNDFPGFFRYVSSSEDQEWKVVHSVGSNEMTGNETILKLPLDTLEVTNSSKITFNWRFKKRGRIRFKFMASAVAGNGLSFFINNNQVGGEWKENSVWQAVEYNVSPGQTYKFDWLVRRQSNRTFSNDAVYLKDIECLEVVRYLDAPTPPDYDTLGSQAFWDPKYEWITYSKSSVVRTFFNGKVTDNSRVRSLYYDMDSECDGTVSFSYKMGAGTPILDVETDMFYTDDLRNKTQTGQGQYGSRADKNHDGNWSGDGSALQTKTNAAAINYELLVGSACTVDAKGTLEIVCPVREIDHYEPSIIRTMENSIWSTAGAVAWTASGTAADRDYILENPREGRSDLSTTVTLTDDGWFTFTFDQDLRSTENFEVLVDNNSMFQATGRSGNSVTIPLKSGNHSITFRVNDSFTEGPTTDSIKKTFLYAYGNDSFASRTGSSDSVGRGWSVVDKTAQTFSNGATITQTIRLNPGAKFELSETLQFTGSPVQNSGHSLVYYDDFNTFGNSGMSFLPWWSWGDLATMENPWSSGDGIYYVRNQFGTFTATIPSISVPQGGYVEFEYGGKYGTFDYMMVTAGNVVVYKGNISSDMTGTKIKAPLPAGTYPLIWTYYNGGTQTVPPSTEEPTNPNGEVCFLAGSQNFPIDYTKNIGDIYSDRTAHFKWGGERFYTSSDLHATDQVGGVITRDFWAPSFGNVSFSERLQVQGGSGTSVTGSYNVPISINRYNQPANGQLFSKNSYYALNVGSPSIDVGGGWATNTFHTNGPVNINFTYMTYVVSTSSIKGSHSVISLDARNRASFRVHLVPEGTAPSKSNMILERIKNYTTSLKQPYSNINSWFLAPIFSLQTNVPAGNYSLIFTLIDTIQGLDVDDEGYEFYAAFTQVSVKVTDTHPVGGVDDTKVRVELINRNTGVVENTQAYGNTGAGYASIIFSGLAANTAYQVRYTLLKGAGTGGGLYNTGGSFSVSSGKFTEQYGAYCKDVNGNYYPKSNSTQRPGTGTSGGYTQSAPMAVGPWGWIDAIQVYAANGGICANTSVELKVTDGSTVLSNQLYNNTNSPQTMAVSVSNNTNAAMTYFVTQTFLSTCGDGATVYGGVATITESIPPRYAYAKVTDFKATNNKAIWMGGCDSSTITVSVLDEIGSSIFSQTYSGGGFHPFDVSNMVNQPYSKYRLSIKTDQKGTTSVVTGKPYMTTFKLVDLKVTENWKNIPDPYNGKLEFFIDGALQATYTTPGGFYQASIPISKGQHSLKWVFTELGSGNTYDYCEIDFIKITNWICDKILVTPYCEPGSGDKCVEELIKCLLKIWKDKPKVCVIGERTWIFT